MITNEEFNQIQERTKQAALVEPRIKAATYEAETLTFWLIGGSVPDGAKVSVPARSLKFLTQATDEQIADMSLTKTGNAIHWDELDEQVSTIALLEIITGLPYAKYDAKATGSIGGKASTAAKSAAARVNGARGGRPRKKPVEA